MLIPATRRAQLGIGVATLFTALLLLHLAYRTESTAAWSARIEEGITDPDSLSRIRRLQGVCEREDEFDKMYGRTNIRMSRAYEGSHYKVRRFIDKVLRGDNVTISVIGGSVTKGHHVYPEEIWFWHLYTYLQELFGPTAQINHVNGAAPAVGSDYFSFCFGLHIPQESDLVLVELAVNDEGINEHVENMENLLRGLLSMENGPAVILAEAVAFSNGGMGGGGGRMHLPVAQYYDVPVINQRHPIANHLARYPELVRPYFAQDYWGSPDTRHINRQGHKDLGNLVSSFIKDVACLMLQDVKRPPAPLPTHPPLPLEKPEDGELPEPPPKMVKAAEAKLQSQLETARAIEEAAGWPEWTRSWPNKPSKEYPYGRLMPGLWNTPAELGMLPRMRVLDGWNPDLAAALPPFHPTCLSTRSTNPRFNLTPTDTRGWSHWVHPEHLDKPYLVADRPGSWAKFDLSTALGVVKVYALKSRSFGLGDLWCWMDEDRDRGVRVEGYWDQDENIGRFEHVTEGLHPGRHTLTCELLEETHDPEGRTEFRLISVMAL